MDEYHCVVSVVGYVAHGKSFSSSKSGVGKSCLCCRFAHPCIDDYIDDHPSLLALHEFESNVVCTDSFLYWGSREIEFPAANRGKGAKVKMEVVEHTLFYHDETSRVFPKFKKIQNVESYAKQTLVPPESSRKISYYSRDCIGFPDRYRCLPYLSNVNRIARGFVVVVDVSRKMPRFEEHLTATQQIVHQLSNNGKHPFIIAAMKRDIADPASLQRLANWASKKKITVVETSAKENTNVKSVFSHIASKILKNARIPDSVLSYSAAVGVSLEESTKAKTAFKRYLKKSVKTSNASLSSIEKSDEYCQCVELLGKFGVDEIYARHLLEVRDNEVKAYSGVIDNPDMRMEMLEQFVDDIMLDLVAHKRTLRSMINTLVSPDDNLYTNEGSSSNASSPEKRPLTPSKHPKEALPDPDDVYECIDEMPQPRGVKVEIDIRNEKKTVPGQVTQIEEYYDRFDSPSNDNKASCRSLVIRKVPSDSTVESMLAQRDLEKLLKRKPLDFPSSTPSSPAMHIKPFGTHSTESVSMNSLPSSQRLKQGETEHVAQKASNGCKSANSKPFPNILPAAKPPSAVEDLPDLSELSISERAKVLKQQLMGISGSSLRLRETDSDSSKKEGTETGNKYGFFTPMETKHKPNNYSHRTPIPPPVSKKPPKVSSGADEGARDTPKPLSIPHQEEGVLPPQSHSYPSKAPEYSLHQTHERTSTDLMEKSSSLEQQSPLQPREGKVNIPQPENTQLVKKSPLLGVKLKPVPLKKPSNYNRVVLSNCSASPPKQSSPPLPMKDSCELKKVTPPTPSQDSIDEDLYVSSSVEDSVIPHAPVPQPYTAKTGYPSPKPLAKNASPEKMPKPSDYHRTRLAITKDSPQTVSSVSNKRPPEYDLTVPPKLRDSQKAESVESEYKPRLDALRKKVEREKVEKEKAAISQSFTSSFFPLPSNSAAPLPIKTSMTPPTQPNSQKRVASMLESPFNNSAQLSHSISMELQSVSKPLPSPPNSNSYSTHTLPLRKDAIRKETTPPPPLPPRMDEMNDFISSEQVNQETHLSTGPIQTVENYPRSMVVKTASSVPSSPRRRKNYVDTFLKLLGSKDGEDKKRGEPVPKPKFVKMRGRPLPAAPESAFDEHSELEYELVDPSNAIDRPPCPPPRHHSQSPPSVAPYPSSLISPPSPIVWYQTKSKGCPTPPPPTLTHKLNQLGQDLMLHSQHPYGEQQHLRPWDHGGLRKPQRSQSMKYHTDIFSSQTDEYGYELTDDWIPRSSDFCSSQSPIVRQGEHIIEYDYPDVRRGVRNPNRLCPPRSSSSSPQKPKLRTPSPPIEQDGDDYVNMQGDLIDDDDYQNAEVINNLRKRRSLDDSHVSDVRKLSKDGSMDDTQGYYNLQELPQTVEECPLPPRIPVKNVFNQNADFIPKHDDIDEETGQTHRSSELEQKIAKKPKPLPPRNKLRSNYHQ